MIKHIKLSFLLILILFLTILSTKSQKDPLVSNDLTSIKDFSKMRILVDKIPINSTNISFYGDQISLKYSTEKFPSIYQGGFSIFNYLTILQFTPILKYQYNQEKINEIESFKDIMIVSKDAIEYKNKRYRGNFKILKKDSYYYIVNIVSLDDYLNSVVPSEMPTSWNLEALKAQAIIARTYAIKMATERRKKGEVFDLYSTVLDQAYYGVDKENEKTSLAVNQTKDLIIVYNNEPIWALYHSNCYGKTIDGKLVFKSRLKEEDNYLCSVECPHQGKKWEAKIETYVLKNTLERILKTNIYSLDNIYTLNFKTYIKYNENQMYSLYNWDLRKMIGYQTIKGPYVNSIQIKDDKIIFSGIGYGHMVGLCQYGANTLAQMGFDYEKIIKYYYKGVKIVDLGRWLENANF